MDSRNRSSYRHTYIDFYNRSSKTSCFNITVGIALTVWCFAWISGSVHSSNAHHASYLKDTQTKVMDSCELPKDGVECPECLQSQENSKTDKFCKSFENKQIDSELVEENGIEYHGNEDESDNVRASSLEYTKKDFQSGSDTEEEQHDNNIEENNDIEKIESDPEESRSDREDIEEDTSDKKAKETIKKKDMGSCASSNKNSDAPKEKRLKQSTLSSYKLKKRHSDLDTQEYRDGYPKKKDDPNLKNNLRFYKGEMKSSPDGDYIDKIHKKWWGKYQHLEVHHGYIQWLFPIREDGMNWQAQALQKHEAEAIIADPQAKARVLKSYEMMLDFYGMELIDPKKGTLKRSRNWEECYNNLNWSGHNYLRITRILKCLGELDFEHLKKPFLEFVLHEALEEKALKNTLRSCRDYWVGTLKSDDDREELYRYIEENGGNKA